MADYQVTCIIKPNRDSPVDRIEQLQGAIVAGGSGSWWGAPHDVAEDIQKGHRFFILVGTARTYLERVPGRNGARDFVRTEPNGRYDDNLLRQPPCSMRYKK